MDSYTERLLERANARKKKLEGYYSEVNETPKIPLQEPNDILKKYENLAKSQPNLTESNRIKRKEVVSDSNLSMKSSNMYNSSIKENLSDSNLRKGCTRMSTDMPSSPQTPTKTLNIQKENFNMEIKLTSSDNVRVEVEIEEREDFSDDDENYGDDENNVKGISKLQNGNDNDNCGEEVLKGIRRIQRDKPKESDDKPVIREGVKNRLQRLGKLYSDDGELSSPIHRTESKFCEEEQSKKEIKKSTVGGRLKALASTRNQWEDELTTTCTKTTTKEVPKKSWKPPAPKPPAVTVPTFAHSPNKGRAPKPPATSSTLSTKVSTKVSSRESTPERTKIASPRNSPVKEGPTNTGIKQVAWDNAVLATLESQGFTRTNSNSKLVYNYEKQSESTKVDLDEIEEEEASNEEDNKKVSKLNIEITDTQVSEDDEEIESDEERIEIPESKVCEPESKILKIASRFGEQRHLDVEDKKPIPKSPKTNLRTGDVLSRAAMFERSPNKAKDSKDPALMTVSERKALFEKNKGAALIPKAAFGMSAPLRINEKDTVASKPATVKPASPHKVQKSTIVPKLPALKKSTSPNKATTESVMSPTKMYIAESGGIASKMKALLEKKSTISQNQIVNSIQEQRQKDLDLLLNRFNKNKHVPQENEIEEDESTDDESVTETTKMISDRAAKIVHFKEKDMPPPPAPPTTVTPPTKSSSAPKRRSKGDSPKVREVLEDVKRIKVIQPKSGRMYPCLSDIETCTETEQEDVPTTAEPSPDTSYDDDENESFDSEDPNTSFGREILEVVCKSQTPQKRPILDESTASDLSDILDDMDDYLDEAMAREDSDCTEGPTPPKHGRSTPPRNVAAPSHSFHFSKGSPAKYGPPVLEPRSPIRQTAASPKSPARPTSSSNGNSYTPKKSIDLPTHVVDDGNVLPLTHTVSFYRKQQAQGSRTPVRQISRQPVVEESPEKDVPDETEEVREKIHELMNVVGKQQTVISQASQALNLCCSTIEFSGSSEQVEAERLLLVATQRRQAALHEVQRLRVEGTLHPGGGASVEKGTLVISDITLPLKKEYVRALSAAGGKGHHVVCLIRLAEHVIPTRLVSTVASPRDSPELNLRVPGSVRLENIYADFTVTVEVYSLQAQEEMLPHELKYHINTKKGGKMTPKKLLKQDSKLVMPSVQSPAGPQAVRSPSFALMGYVVFSLQGINRTHWTLNNAPAMSVLEGSVQMRVNCEMAVSVEHRGFLTMFEDVSGFGAWHRRWCLLKGHTLSYWKYPDDERKKTAIDTLNLQICSTKKVGQVSRDICARPHTFLLETVRTALPGDTDTLVTVCRGDKTLIRHLLSADTKQERVEWCEKFNKALDALRLWGGNRK